MTCEEIIFNSQAYRDALALRESVLRIPLGLILATSDIEEDGRQLHFGAFDKGTLVGCVLAKPLPERGVFKLRQMAVAPPFQGRNVGRQLIAYVEDALMARECHRIELSARQTAAGFYEKLGYLASGELYPEQGIPHIKMHKNL